MGEVRNQFTFYRSYYEALLPLPRENQAAIILAVCAYALYEKKPEGLTAVESAAFNLIRPTLDTARQKARSGKAGGEAKKKQTASKAKASPKQTASKPEANRKLERERGGERELERELEREGILYPPIVPPFTEVWTEIVDIYPEDHVGDVKEAERIFRSRITSAADANSMLSNLKLWKRSEQWTKENGQYIPLLSNWIGRGIWNTKPAKMVPPKGVAGELGQAELEAIQQLLKEGRETDG